MAIAGTCVLCLIVGALAPKKPAGTSNETGRVAPSSTPTAPAPTPAAQTDASPSAVTPDASTEAPSLPPGAHRVGETWTLGECTYTVARVESAERVGDRYLNETAASGAVFVLARYTERNNSSETITASSDNVVLRDPQGRSFRPSSRVQVMLQADLLPELQPGVQHDHRVGFEVPVDVIRAPFDPCLSG